MGGKKKPNFRLRLARKRLGLSQKQVAKLLNHRSTKQISRFETGERLPNLQAALKLEKVYGVPFSVLFSEAGQQAFLEVRARAQQIRISSPLKPESSVCTYRQILQAGTPSQEDIDRVRAHAIEITKRLSDVINASSAD
jgi:transcriptional regulator with XRE-family HTH domain